jgi:hypothetical protein
VKDAQITNMSLSGQLVKDFYKKYLTDQVTAE